MARRIVPFILAALIMILPLALNASADDAGRVVVVSGGVRPRIVPNDSRNGEELFAAELLRDYIEKITGVRLDISGEAEQGGIRLDSPELVPASAESGSYRVAEKDGVLYITGLGKHGLTDGVFGFLDKCCGCRWYTDTLKKVPKSAEISVEKGLDFEYTPYFEYEQTDWRTTPFNYNTRYARGNEVSYISGFCHTLTTQYCSSAEYFGEHPEYFALHDGKRSPNQLCLTNPDTIELVKSQVLETARSHASLDGSTQIISVTQHDNGDYCECENCKALDEANGSHAGTMVTFANIMADALKEAGLGKAVIDTFAYQYTRKAPSKVRPRDNVIIRLCDIECCFGHTLDDPKCGENAAFMADLEDWSKICGRIYIWDYGTNYGETMNFFPNFRVLQHNMQTFYEHNVKGIFGEGAGYEDRCDGEFAALRSYLECRLMHDPYLDFDAELDDFLEAYYGAGGGYIKDFIYLCCDRGVTYKKRAEIFERSKGSLPGLKAKDIKECDELWEKAKAAAEGDELQRVLRSEICWRYWKCSNSKREFTLFQSLFRLMKARDELYKDIVGMGNTLLGEPNRKRVISGCAALHLLRIPFKWTDLYENDFWFFISPFVEKVYELGLKAGLA